MLLSTLAVIANKNWTFVHVWRSRSIGQKAWKKKKNRKHKKSTLDIEGVVPSTLFMLPLTLEALTKSWTQKDQLI